MLSFMQDKFHMLIWIPSIYVCIMWGLALKILQWKSISQVILMQIIR